MKSYLRAAGLLFNQPLLATPDTVEMAINRMVQKLESEGENDISTQRIGSLVMAELKKLDAVAYIRYASVYRDFSDAEDFEQFVEKL